MGKDGKAEMSIGSSMVDGVKGGDSTHLTGLKMDDLTH